jgi:protein involved in polysaccharide export with SLBB domain
MTRRSPWGLSAHRLIVLFALFGTSGCATVKQPTNVATLKPAGPPSEGEYKIQVGDQIDVKFYFNPDLNEHVVVRPDGMISMQLVPEIKAAGLTPKELTEALKKEYSRELAKPELSVIMRTFTAQRIYVGGEVGRPGDKPLVGTVTVLQAIAMAEGFRETAKTTEVVLIRRRPDGHPQVIPLNIKAAIAGQDMSQDPALLPYDVVHVPRSGLAMANLFVDQAIRKMIPVSFGFRLDRIFFDESSPQTNRDGGTDPISGSSQQP